jgi:hypothetical protein
MGFLKEHIDESGSAFVCGKMSPLDKDVKFNDLGNLYKNQCKLEETEKMYLRALQRYEKA